MNTSPYSTTDTLWTLELSDVISAFNVAIDKKGYQKLLDEKTAEEQVKFFFPKSHLILIPSKWILEDQYLLKINTRTALIISLCKSKQTFHGFHLKFCITEFEEFIEYILEGYDPENISKEDVEVYPEDYDTLKEFQEAFDEERKDMEIHSRYLEAFGALAKQCKESGIDNIIEFDSYEMENETAGMGFDIKSSKKFKEYEELFKEITFVHHLQVPDLKKVSFWNIFVSELCEKNKK